MLRRGPGIFNNVRPNDPDIRIGASVFSCGRQVGDGLDHIHSLRDFTEYGVESVKGMGAAYGGVLLYLLLVVSEVLSALGQYGIGLVIKLLVELAYLFLLTVFLPCQDILGVRLGEGILEGLAVTLVDDVLLSGKVGLLYLLAGYDIELLAGGASEL